MTRALVTGCAGFIGSHVAERLLADGVDVVGVDAFTPFYDRAEKERNLAGLGGMRLVSGDLATMDLGPVLDGVTRVYHLAAQAGVRSSWGHDFAAYVHHNILATQRLLEACVGRDLEEFVYASSSSVYGECAAGPVTVHSPVNPVSPYGVTKLAGERLCLAYADAHRIPVVALRYFTVYGPRQRPDMGIRKFIEAALDGTPITLFGDWSQTREYTYVDDVVTATTQSQFIPGRVANVSGGQRVGITAVLRCIAEAVGKPVLVQPGQAQAGDVGHTQSSDSSWWLASPLDLQEGIRRQVAWCRARREALVQV